MRLRAVQRFTTAVGSVLALASVAAAQPPPLPGEGASWAAGAERLTYGADAGLGETDNVFLSPDNKVSQTMATVDVDFDVRHRSRVLDVDAKGYFADYAYLQGAYGNQVLGRFDGVSHIALIPQRLIWVVQDNFGQAALDPFAPTTPVNQEHVNYFSTGPDVTVRVGGTGFIDMGVRYSRAQFQRTPFSSNRGLGNIGAGLQLSARSSISLNAVGERVLFDNTRVNGNFTRTSGYLRYEIQGARTFLSVDLGATKVNQAATPATPGIPGQNGSPAILPTTGQRAYTVTGPLAKISVSRRLSSASTLALSASRELTDASSNFSGIQAGALGVAGSASAALTSSSYTSNFASATWLYQRNRTTIGVSGRWEKDVYRNQPQFNLTNSGLELNLSRKLTRALAMQAFGRYGKTNYANAYLLPLIGSPKYDDMLVGAALTWRHSRMIEVRLRAEHSSRTTPGFNQGYRENRVFLTIGYRPEIQKSNDSPPELIPVNDNPGG